MTPAEIRRAALADASLSLAAREAYDLYVERGVPLWKVAQRLGLKPPAVLALCAEAKRARNVVERLGDLRAGEGRRLPAAVAAKMAAAAPQRRRSRCTSTAH